MQVTGLNNAINKAAASVMEAAVLFHIMSGAKNVVSVKSSTLVVQKEKTRCKGWYSIA